MMARYTIDGLDEVEKMFQRLGSSSQIGEKAVRAAVPHLLSETKKAVKAAGGTDSLAKSFDATEPRTSQYGTYAVVRPFGRNRKKNTEYVRLAAFLEYGTTWPKKQKDADKIHHGKQRGMPKQDPHPWRDKALHAAEAKCRAAIMEALDKEVDKLI